MSIRLVRTEHVLPAPMMSEAQRQNLIDLTREGFRVRGGVVIAERRVRNIAFDKRGEKTTTTFVVEWPA